MDTVFHLLLVGLQVLVALWAVVLASVVTAVLLRIIRRVISGEAFIEERVVRTHHVWIYVLQEDEIDRALAGGIEFASELRLPPEWLESAKKLGPGQFFGGTVVS